VTKEKRRKTTKANKFRMIMTTGLSDVWVFYGTDITLEGYQSRKYGVGGGAKNGLDIKNHEPIKASSQGVFNLIVEEKEEPGGT
jgi:hypothetical protein